MMLTALIVIGLAVCGFIAFLFDSLFGKEDFASGFKAANLVVKIIRDRGLEAGNFYDLGSAYGSFAITIAKNLPQMKIIGVDDGWLRIVIAEIRGIFLKNLAFKRADIYSIDLSPANIIYIYLPQDMMPGLQDKLQKVLKPGAVIITNKVNFPTWQPIEKLDKLFIYVKN